MINEIESRAIPHFQNPRLIPVIPTNATNKEGSKQQRAHKPINPIPAKNFFNLFPPFYI